MAHKVSTRTSAIKMQRNPGPFFICCFWFLIHRRYGSPPTLMLVRRIHPSFYRSALRMCAFPSVLRQMMVSAIPQGLLPSDGLTFGPPKLTGAQAKTSQVLVKSSEIQKVQRLSLRNTRPNNCTY